jgi:hypothetical protein
LAAAGLAVFALLPSALGEPTPATSPHEVLAQIAAAQVPDSPARVEGRIGLGITALLTLVALQLTSSATLPDVDYLMMLDKIYLLAYVFIIVSLARVVMTSWRSADDQAERSITRADRIWVSVLLAAYLAVNALIVLPALV